MCTGASGSGSGGTGGGSGSGTGTDSTGSTGGRATGRRAGGGSGAGSGVKTGSGSGSANMTASGSGSSRPRTSSMTRNSQRRTPIPTRIPNLSGARGSSAMPARLYSAGFPRPLVRQGSPRQPLLLPFRQATHDEVVRVLDQVPHEPARQAPIESDRVPVALVQVVARADRRIRRPQLDRKLRLTFDTDRERRLLERTESKHLPRNLEHRSPRTKRKLLNRPGLAQTPTPQLSRVHDPDDPKAEAPDPGPPQSGETARPEP